MSYIYFYDYVYTGQTLLFILLCKLNFPGPVYFNNNFAYGPFQRVQLF